MEKLFIQPYSDSAYQNKAGSPFYMLINPETYTIKYKIEFCDTQAPGTSTVALKFNKIPPQDFNFDFLFDSTGVVKNLSGNTGETKSVADQIEEFKHNILDYKGELHRPNYLKVHWGTLLFKGIITTMDIEFKLFNPDGTPIRAVAKCTFKATIEENLRVAIENSQSSDITHERQFKAGDRLTLVAKNIYNDQNYYIDVAGFNKLDSFRTIQTGTNIFFPPIK